MKQYLLVQLPICLAMGAIVAAALYTALAHVHP